MVRLPGTRRFYNRNCATGPTGPEADLSGVEGQIINLEQQVFNLEQQIMNLENQINTFEGQIINLEGQIFNLGNYILQTDYAEIWSQSPEMLSMGVGVIRSGHTYSFWGIGTLDHPQSFDVGVPYYLITSAQYPDLQFYQGETTITFLWIETVSGSQYLTTLQVDQSGIYFVPTTLMNLTEGTRFRFTQMLILDTPFFPFP